MSVTTETVYCLRGTWVCQTHSVTAKFDEGNLNAHVAELASGSVDPAVARAVVAAIWGDETPTRCKSLNCSSRAFTVVSSGDDADWILVCADSACGRQVARAEHKPRSAPRQWSRASVETLRTDAVVGCPAWIADVADSCGRVDHTDDQCAGSHPWDVSGKHLAVPQVLAYTLRDDFMPVTIVCDSADSNPTAIYDANHFADPGQTGRTAMPLTLNPDFFPIRTTATVLNDLAAGLADLDLVGQKLVDGTDLRATVIAVFEAMWLRAGTPPLSPLAESWIRPEALNCQYRTASIAGRTLAASLGCEIVPWARYRGAA